MQIEMVVWGGCEDFGAELSLSKSSRALRTILENNSKTQLQIHFETWTPPYPAINKIEFIVHPVRSGKAIYIPSESDLGLL